MNLTSMSLYVFVYLDKKKEVKEIKSFLFFIAGFLCFKWIFPPFLLNHPHTCFSFFFIFSQQIFFTLPLNVRENSHKRLHIIYVRLSRLSKCGGDEGNNKVKL